MIRIKGTFFNGQNSKAFPAELISDGKWLKVVSVDNQILVSDCYLKSSVTISSKLGSTPRIIRFKQGQQFEPFDQDAVDNLEHLPGINKPFALIHHIETRKKWVLICLAGLILSVYTFIKIGIPVIAEHIAFRLPLPVIESVSQDAENIMGNRLFHTSRLSSNQKVAVETALARLIEDMNATRKYRFEITFKKSPIIGANAFALPSGKIIITDELVTMAKNIREIEGILVHEIAHITERHGIRSVIQNTGVFLLISMLVGDVASITSLAAGIPTLLVETGYSRTFESQADEAVAKYFFTRGWDIQPFTDILSRLDKTEPLPGTELMSTHPETAQRIKDIETLMTALKHKTADPQ